MKKILLALIALLTGASVAFAQSSDFQAKNGTPTWVTRSGYELNLGSASTDPINLFTNNTKRWYIDGSTGALTASSGVGMAIGGNITYSATTTTISSSTSDAADTGKLTLSGGGGTAVDGTRGATLGLFGNENAGAGKADLTLGATGDFRVIGNTGGTVPLTVGGSASAIVTLGGPLYFSTATSTIRPGATSFQINNNANSVANFKINDAGDVHVVQAKDLVFDVGLGTVALQEAVAGTACMGTLTCNGASDVVTSTTCATTGSRIFLTRTSLDADTTGDFYVKAISNGVSFTVACEALDTGTLNWIIFHEAP